MRALAGDQEQRSSRIFVHFEDAQKAEEAGRRSDFHCVVP
jgi:hypothetical protein